MHKKKGRGKEVIASKPQVRVGKYGVTDNLVKEIIKYLRKEKIVKVKVLKTFLKDETCVKDVAEEIAKRTSSEVIDVRGHTFTLVKYSKNKEMFK